MTITPLIPAGTRLQGDLAMAEGILARARTAAPLTSPGTFAFTRIAIRAFTPAEVDAVAAEWGTRPRWTADGTQYTASTGTATAQAEITWYAPAAGEQGTAGQEAAA